MGDDSVNVIGVGYIGSAIATVLLERGYDVCGIDTDAAVIDGIRQGSYRYPEVQAPLGAAVGDGLTVSTDYEDIEGSTHVVCVGTPTADDGSMDASDLISACRSLGKQLSRGDIVIVRSTIAPGTSQDRIIPILEEESGLSVGTGFSYCYQPEFLRGGSAIADLRDPEKTVLSGDDRAIERARELLPVGRNCFEIRIREAEAVKYLDNTFHALKVTFANEVLRWSADEGVDAGVLMDVLKSDHRLNISEAYLDPGYPFGGPCLEKDVRVVRHRDGEHATPVMDGILDSNASHLDWLVQRVKDGDGGTVGLLGLAYKGGAHSTHNSPALRLADRLREEGYDVVGYDPRITTDTIPQADGPEDVVEQADVLIVMNPETVFEGLDVPESVDLIDLHDVTRDPS